MTRTSLASLTTIFVVSANLAFAQGATAVKPLEGYQCMSLAKLWDGQGPEPAPVLVFSGPEAGAASVGAAGGTVIVPSPIRPVNGRSLMIYSNGRQVWINMSDITAFHAKANPKATCRPVLLSNGRYGFDSGH